MSLLDARRRKIREVSDRRGKTISEVIWDFQQDILQSGRAAGQRRPGAFRRSPRRGKAAASWGNAFELSAQAPAPRPGINPSAEVLAFSDRHAVECQNLFSKEEKKANVREIVRDIMAGISPGVEKSPRQSQASMRLQLATFTTEVKDSPAAVRKSLRAGGNRDSRIQPQASSDEALKQSFTAKGESSGEDLLAFALMGRYITAFVLQTIVSWKGMVRKERWERKRAALQGALVWDDPERASVLMKARETLVQADRLSWFKVDTRGVTSALHDVRSAFPLTAPPTLRGDTCDDFVHLAESLRQQIKDMIFNQQARLAEQEKEVMQRWILKERSKDIRRVKTADEHVKRHLEHTKRQLAQAPAFLNLVERIYLTCVVRSIEHAAIFLTQIFSDTACLQIRVMAVPKLPQAGGETGGGRVALFPSPTHMEVQTHINSLLQSVLTAATSVMTIREDMQADADVDLQQSGGAWRSTSSMQLHSYLIVSIPYRKAVENLDRQLGRSFASVEQRLVKLGKQFGGQLLTRVALLSEYYTDRARLAQHIGATSNQDSHVGPAGSNHVSLASFLLYWFAGPHAELDDLANILKPLFLCGAQLFSEGPEIMSDAGPMDQMPPGKGAQSGSTSNSTLTPADSFHSNLLVVAQGSTCLADFMLRQLIRLTQPKEASMQPFSNLHDLEHTFSLCNWFQAHVEQCQRWQESVREMRIVYQCGPFALDTKYLSFIASQIATASLGVSVYLLNLYAIYNGKLLWRNVQNTVRDLNQQVSSVAELVQQMELLSGIYPLIAKYHTGKKQLERLLYTLTCVVRDPLLADVVARLVGHHVQLDDHSGRLSAGVVSEQQGIISDGFTHGNPGGSLSTNLLFFLVKRIEEVLGRLESRTDEVVANTARRVIPFHHKVQDEIMTVNANARAIRAEMEQILEPSPSMASDVRCQALLRPTADSAQSASPPSGEAKPLMGAAVADVPASRGPPRTTFGGDTSARAAGDGVQLESEQPLTVGGLKSYVDIEDRLTGFEQRCQELESWRRLILQFEEFANKESISLSVPVVSIDTVLLKKLAELKVFWSSAHEWDHSVDRFLQTRPDQVRINAVQRQAHVTLRAVELCPQEHRKLLRERVDSFRRLLHPLFLVQVLVSLSPSRAFGSGEMGGQGLSSAGSSAPGSAPPVAGAGLAMLSSASSMSAANMRDGDDAGVRRGGMSSSVRGGSSTMPGAGRSQMLGGNAQQAEDREREVPVFAPEQNHIWEGLFGPVPASSGDRAISDIVETITSLRALVRTGALYRSEQVKHHYELAMQEMHVVGRLLEVIGHWSHRLLPIVPQAAGGMKTVIVGSGASLVQRLEEHRTMLDELLEKSRSYGSTEEGSESQQRERTSSGQSLTMVSDAYLKLAREWQVRLARMEEHCVQFLECQAQWLKISVLLHSSVPPTGKGGIALRQADKEFREIMVEMTEFPVLRHCFEDVLNSQHLGEISGRLKEAMVLLSQDLQAMRCACHRLFFIEDDLLLGLWGYSGLSAAPKQMATINAVIPKLFPGWERCSFEPLFDAHGLRAVAACPSGQGLPLRFRQSVALVGTPDQWVTVLVTVIEDTFRSMLQELVPFVSESVLKKEHEILREQLEQADEFRWHEHWLKRDEAHFQRHVSAGTDSGDSRPSGMRPDAEFSHERRSTQWQPTDFVVEEPSSDKPRLFRSRTGQPSNMAFSGQSNTPDHIAVTAERIKWSALVESFSSHHHGLTLLHKYIAKQLDALVQSVNRVGAQLTFFLECRDLLDRARHERMQADDLVFLRVGWRNENGLALGIDHVQLDFGWEFYGSEFLSCPVSERHFLTVAQQLNTCKSTLLQGKIGGTVSQCFAAACGIPCHQVYVTSKGGSLSDLFLHLLGGGLAGHWVMIHGVDQLEELHLNTLLKHLATFFLQLNTSIQVFSNLFLQQQPPRHTSGARHSVKASTLNAFCSFPPGVLRIRDTFCYFFEECVSLPFEFRQHANAYEKLFGRSLERSTSCPHLHRDSNGEQRHPSKASREREQEGMNRSNSGPLFPLKDEKSMSSLRFRTNLQAIDDDRNARGSASQDGAGSSLPQPDDLGAELNEAGHHTSINTSMYIPTVLHPRVAVFLAPASERGELKSFIFRIASFHRADLVLYIRAGLIRAGIYDPDVAKTFSHAVNTFNSYTAGHGGSKSGQHSFSKHLGVPEVRSVCALAGALRRSRVSQADSQVDDQTLLCEAWLCAISALLDATTERELLWHCTCLTFGGSAGFMEKEPTFRQNLFNDTLVSQRFIKKDWNARFYDQIADNLKQKYSFFNPLIVQKCLATTNALMQQRNVVVVGEAGTGKTDCVSTLLESGRHFAAEGGRMLFPNIRLLRVNTIAHNTHHIIRVITRAATESGLFSNDTTSEDVFRGVAPRSSTTGRHPQAQRRTAVSAASPKVSADASTWLILDGPLEPLLLASVSSPTPLQMLESDPVLLAPLPLRIIIETDQLCHVSPAFASALAIIFIDTQRGPTWKDKVVAWAHQLVLTCPEYANLMGIVRDLLVGVMDSILAFVLYYFHSAARDDSAAGASGEGSIALLDYKHQTTSFLSFFTSLLLDPVIEEQLFKASSDSEAIDRHVRLLIAMSSISSFGSSLFTHQRPRFERYIRERVLTEFHRDSLPPLYDLYFDSKTGTFQAVNELVRLSKPIIEEHNICVATEEFIAFQLRLRRLTAIAVPVMLAGTAGSGKSTLLRYLFGSPSPGVVFVLYRTSTASTVSHLQGTVIHRLRVQEGAFLAPPSGKRFVVLIDDLHMSNTYTQSGSSKNIHETLRRPRTSASNAVQQHGEDASAVFGGYSKLAEWMRFTLEHRGFYNEHDHTFMSVRDVSFLPSLLSPDSQSLPFCKRFSRHFFVVFMEIPSQESIEKIFSTVLSMNLMPVFDDLLAALEPASSVSLDGGKQQREGHKQAVVASMLEATLNVCKEADLGAKQRLHGLARVFCNLSHTFELAPSYELRSFADMGFLWAYAMRTFVLDAFLQVEQSHRRRQVYGAIVRSCGSSFGAFLGGREDGISAALGMGEASKAKAKQLGQDTEAQAAELDTLVYSSFDSLESRQESHDLVVRRSSLAKVRADLLEYFNNLSSPGVEGSRPGSSASGTSAADGEASSAQDRSMTNFDRYRELLSEDVSASTLWLYDDTLLSTLLRLCHTMYLHPVVCVVGGWAHFPLLTLVSQLFGGEKVRMCTKVSAKTLEKELFGAAASGDDLPAGTGSSASPWLDNSASYSASRTPRRARVRILAIDEEEVPASALAAFLNRERGRYFRPRKPNDQDAQSDPSLSQHTHTCLAIICRSPISFQSLATRCVFVQHVVSATFVLPSTISFHQVAVTYLPKRLSGIVPMNALPKQQKRFFMSKKSFAVDGLASSEVRRGSGDRATDLERTFFSPLAQCTEAMHMRIQQTIASEYGKEFANDFCTPFRFANFLRMITRLARQFFTTQAKLTSTYSGALNTLDALRSLRFSLGQELRAVRVSLRLLVEEAGRLTSRVARLTAKRLAARDALSKTKKRQHALEARIMAVDSRYGAEFSKAQAAVDAAMRDLVRLEPWYFDDLGKFMHPPLPIVKTMETMHTVVSYLKQIDTEESFDASATAGSNPPDVQQQAQNGTETDSGRRGAGRSKPALSVCKEFETPRVTKNELERWREAVATKDVLPCLQQWSTRSHLPPWLSDVLERYVTDPTCHPHVLREISSAASHFASWLTARLNCHKVLDKMETKRQSMGDLSQQRSTLNEELGGATSAVNGAEEELKELMDMHTRTVQQREEQMKNERKLQDRVQRVSFVISAYDVRHREFEVQAQNVHDTTELQEQWGGLLYTAALGTYGVTFNPVVRAAVMKEVRSVLTEFDIAIPKNISTMAYLKPFLPSSFLNLAQSHWHDRYMFDSATMVELANTRCTIILDPFELGLEWLDELYAQRYPVKPHGRLMPYTGHIQHLTEKQHPAPDGPAKELRSEDVEQPRDWELDPYGAHVRPTVLTGVESAPAILEHLQHCMETGSTLIIQVHSSAQLEGFIGSLLVLLQSAENCLSMCTDGASVDFRVRPKSSGDDSSGGSSEGDHEATVALVQLFDLIQQLEHALPLPYRHFKVFVLVPRCSWNELLWGPLRQKRAEQLRKFPAMLWSVCNIISLDSRPVHPSRMMLPAFREAQGGNPEGHENVQLQARFDVQNTQLQVIEDVLLCLLVGADQSSLDGELFHHSVQRYNACAKRLATCIADSSHRQRVLTQRICDKYLPLAGAAVVLLCALMDAESARGGSSSHEEWRIDSTSINRLNAHVDGFALAPRVMHQLLVHQLHCTSEPKAALSELLTMVMCAVSERHAAILRVMLVLEGGLIRNKELSALWESLLRHSAGTVEPRAESPSGSKGAASEEKGEGEDQSSAKPSDPSTPSSGQIALPDFKGARNRGSVRSDRTSEKSGQTSGSGSISSQLALDMDMLVASGPPRSSMNDNEPHDSGKGGEGASRRGSTERAGSVGSVEPGSNADLASALASVIQSGTSPDSSTSKDHDDTEESESEEHSASATESSSTSEDEEKSPEYRDQDTTLGFLEQDALMNRRDLADLIRELCKMVSKSFAAGHPKRHFEVQLHRLPPQVPIVVTHNAISVVSTMAQQLSVEVKEESAISIKDKNIAQQVGGILASSSTWLLFDLADVSDFGELARFLESLQRDRPKPFLSNGQEASAGAANQPSRLWLYSSADTTEVPRYVLRLCFCVQSVMRFFGLRPQGLPDDEELSSSSESSISSTPDSESDESPASGTSGTGTSPRSRSEKSERRSHQTHQTHVARHNLKALAMASESKSQLLVNEIINHLTFTHPLLTVQPMATHDEKFVAVMSDIVSALNPTVSLTGMVNCLVEEVPDWIESNVVLPAHMWVQKNAIYAMLQTFSPTLIRQNDMQLKETLHAISAKLVGMLQRVSATASMLTAESPFWLLLELNRTAARLQAARTDLSACYSALLGDVHWNAHLFAVYASVSHGRAIWAGARPLATWLTSLEEHVSFLTGWKSESADLMPFRIGSVSDIGSFFSSYSRDTEKFHLRLEKRPSPAWQASLPSAVSKALVHASQLMGTRGSSSRTPSMVPLGNASGGQSVTHRPSRSRAHSPGQSIVAETIRDRKEGDSLSMNIQARHDAAANLLVEGLHLVGCAWINNRIADAPAGADYEVDLPPMMIRPVKGPPPRHSDWFSCPLIIAHDDAFGADLASTPVAYVMVRTTVPAPICAIRGVRLVSYG